MRITRIDIKLPKFQNWFRNNKGNNSILLFDVCFCVGWVEDICFEGVDLK